MKRWKIVVMPCVLFLVMALPLKAIAELTVSTLKNCEFYTLKWNTQDRFEQKFKLVNGEYEKRGPGLTEIETLSIDKIAIGDLNGDGKKDGAVILLHNTGGSGTCVQVAALLDVNGQPRHIASRNLGDRTEIKGLEINKGFIVINLENSRFFPGQKKIVKYKLVKNKLVGPKPFK